VQDLEFLLAENVVSVVAAAEMGVVDQVQHLVQDLEFLLAGNVVSVVAVAAPEMGVVDQEAEVVVGVASGVLVGMASEVLVALGRGRECGEIAQKAVLFEADLQECLRSLVVSKQSVQAQTTA